MRRSQLFSLVALVLISVSAVTAFHSAGFAEPSRYVSNPIKRDSNSDAVDPQPKSGEPDVGQMNGDVDQQVFSPVVSGLGMWASAFASRFWGLGF